jgi:hypothetical protein
MQAARPPPWLAESQRQAQLSSLLPLLPEGPGRLLDAYRGHALSFQLHKVGLTVATILWKCTLVAFDSVCKGAVC